MEKTIRVTIEEINPETEEVVNTLVSEEKDGLYEGVCLLGDKGETAQVCIHRLSGADLCTFIAGSKDLSKAAKIATMFAQFKGSMGDDNGAN